MKRRGFIAAALALVPGMALLRPKHDPMDNEILLFQGFQHIKSEDEPGLGEVADYTIVDDPMARYSREFARAVARKTDDMIMAAFDARDFKVS